MRYPLLSSLLLMLALAAPSHAAEPLDFPLYTIDGEQHWLADYRGRWVVVNYWATWCPPCLEEIPELEIFHDQHKDTDAVVLGINFEDIDTDELREFIAEHFISFPIFHQRPRRKTPFGRLTGLPSTYVLTPEGETVAMQAGGITADVLERFIKDYEAKHGSSVNYPPNNAKGQQAILSQRDESVH